MAHVITFTTSRFDIANEPPNPINPIAGQSVLAWLRGELDRAGWRTTDPDTEDWGWYIEADGAAGTYLVGASADAHEPTAEVEWTIQVHKTRSLKDKLFAAAVVKMSFRLRGDEQSPAFNGIYPGLLRDLELEDAAVEKYISENREHVETAARGKPA